MYLKDISDRGNLSMKLLEKAKKVGASELDPRMVAEFQNVCGQR